VKNESSSLSRGGEGNVEEVKKKSFKWKKQHMEETLDSVFCRHTHTHTHIYIERERF